jgi:flagellar hook-length control protein FliK
MASSNASRPTTTDNAAASNNSFQKVLSSQVQQRQQKTDGQQAKPAVSNVKSPEAEQKAADTKAADAKVDEAASATADTQELGDQFKDLALIAKQEKDLKGKTDKSEETTLTTDAAPILTTDPAVAALAIPANVPVTPADKPALTTEDAAAAQKPQVETTDSRPRGRLDQELGNMLAQSRSESAADTSQLADAGSDQAEMSAWLEKMLPGFNSAGETAKLADQAAKTESTAVVSPQVQAVAATTTLTPVQTSEVVGSSNTITPYPGRTGWDQAIGQKVAWMVAGGEQSATLTLNPPDMGPLQVVIHVHNDIADATFMSNNQEVRQALQDGMSNLRDMLNASGIQLGQSNVGEHTQSQQQLAQASGRSGSGAAGGSADSDALDTPVPQTVVRSGNGMVDTFV